MDLVDFEKILTDNRVEFVTIRVPHHGSGWQVNLRDGPGWACGVHCQTLTEALETSVSNFRRTWADKRTGTPATRDAVVEKSAPIDDALGDLLG